jgi:hypothetical protein
MENLNNKFNFKLYIRTKQGQEFLVNSLFIDAKNYDEAASKFNRLDLPFHHFATVKKGETTISLSGFDINPL